MNFMNRNTFIDSDAAPARLWRRIAAAAIDLGLYSTISSAVGKAVLRSLQVRSFVFNEALTANPGPVALKLSLGLHAFFTLCYFVLPTLRWGQSPGKMLVAIKTVDSRGSDAVGLGRLLLREFVGKWLLVFACTTLCMALAKIGSAYAMAGGALMLVSYFVTFARKNHRALHDYLAHTVVVEVRRRYVAGAGPS